MSEQQNGDSVRITRATLALIIAVSAPLATGAVAEYRLREAERAGQDREARLRRVEIAIAAAQQNQEELKKQSEQLEALRAEVRELTRQIDRSLR